MSGSGIKQEIKKSFLSEIITFSFTKVSGKKKVVSELGWVSKC